MKKMIPLPSEHLVLVKERKLFDLLHNHDIVEPLEASGVYFKDVVDVLGDDPSAAADDDGQ